MIDIMELVKLANEMSTSEEIPLSLEEKFECDPYSFFPNCPENALTVLENLIDLRLSDLTFFPVGGWETIKGINPQTSYQDYRVLIAKQLDAEHKSYISFLASQC